MPLASVADVDDRGADGGGGLRGRGPVVAVDADEGPLRVPRAGQRPHPATSRSSSPTSTARSSPTPAARCSAGWRSSSSPAASRRCSRASFSDQVSTGVDVFSFRQPLGVVRRDHAVQLPGDGADVDAPGGHRVRQHLRAQAQRARPHRVDARRRAVGRGRAARRRVQRGARRQGGRRRAARPPRRRRGLVRRVDPDRPLHPRARHRQRQARAGPRRRQEPRDRPARRRRSTTPPTTSSPPPSARRASAAWRSPRRSPSAAAADDLVAAVSDKARAVKVGPRPRPRQRDGPGRHRRGAGPHRRAHRHRRPSRAPSSPSTAAGSPSTGHENGFFVGPDRDRPGDHGDGRLPRGDLRPGALGRARRHRGRGDRADQRQPVRQRHRDLHVLAARRRGGSSAGSTSG